MRRSCDVSLWQTIIDVHTFKFNYKIYEPLQIFIKRIKRFSKDDTTIKIVKFNTI